MVSAREAFDSSDPAVTTRYYDELIRRGPLGQVAFGLFRAQKKSARAKAYRRRRHSRGAYDGKAEALRYLNAALALEGQIRWGWGTDAAVPFHRHVLYVDLPPGQVSFHSESNFDGPDYPGKWDGLKGESERRIVEFCDRVWLKPREDLGDWLLMPFGTHVGKLVSALDADYVEWITRWEGIGSWPLIREVLDGQGRPAAV